MSQLPITDIARITGYGLQKGIPINNTSILPQRIAVIAEMNTANQSTSLTPVQITSRAQEAALYGWGSPIDLIMAILLPNTNIPVWAYPVAAAVSSVANSQTITITGTGSANVTHTVLICGRSGTSFGSYDLNIVTGETPTTAGVKLFNAINGALGCPIISTKSAGVVTTTANWTGISSEGITINILTNGNAAGMSYAVAEAAAGSGLPSVQPALNLFGADWITIVVDSWGIVNGGANITKYVAFNGNPNTQTGRYDPLLMKPAVYITGDVTDSSTSSADTTVTSGLANELTMAVAPAPLSLGLPMEAAANMAINFANISQNSANIDVQNIPYVDMPGPLPTSAPPLQTANYALRNSLVGLGMSTVIYNKGQYFPQDFVTTYAPAGENPPAWRYPRDIMIDLIIRYLFSNLQKSLIVNKQIANDNDQVTAANVVKPKDIKAALVQLAYDLVTQGFTTNAAFMIASISVIINPANKNRFDISFSYDRSGVTRVISNVATAY